MLRTEGHPLFSRHQQSWHVRHHLLLALQLFLDSLDFVLVLSPDLFQLLRLLRLGKLAGLRLKSEDWLFIGIVGRPGANAPPAQETVVLSAVGIEFDGV